MRQEWHLWLLILLVAAGALDVERLDDAEWVRKAIRSQKDSQHIAPEDFPSRGLSARTWFHELVDRYGARPRHAQRYQQHGGRQLAVLTENNTAAMRVHLNFATLYEENVQANSFTKDRYCFREGAWFRMGYPGEKPEHNGPDSCGDRTTTIVTGDRWCICTANDLVTEHMRDFVIHSTTEVMKQLPNFIRVKPVEGNLTFRNFEGSFPAMWKSTGQTGAACDPDCQKGLHVVVPESFCSEGLAADAVLSVSLPPPLPGVGGAGTFCSGDQHGRPTHLIFQWHRRVTMAQFLQSSREELVAQWRGLILHEAIHGLGFGTGLWRNSFDSSGQRKEIVKQLEVQDEDGSRDYIYHFVQGTRTYEVAKAYFGCEDDAAWQGLPLMSWPPSGRDTHHETRVLRDDVMSYGDGLEAVSAVTLAALEDTGHYFANYSSAECMWWGKGRGCAFVKQRCQARPEGDVVTGEQASQCARTWSTSYSAGNREALQKCILPDCRSRTVGGEATCDAECFTGEDASDACTQNQAPSTPVAAAGVVGWAEDMAQQIVEYDFTMESLENLASVTMAPLCFLSVCCVLKCFLCPWSKPGRVRLLFYLLSVISFLPGLALFAAGGYIGLNWAQFQVFFSVEFVAGAQGLALFVVSIAGFGIYAVWDGSNNKKLCFLVMQTVEVFLLVAALSLLAKFAMDLDNMTTDALSQTGATPLASSPAADVATRWADQVTKELMSLSCRTYQVCCENSELLDLRVANGAPRQCKAAHAGFEEDVAFILSDPSHPSFCPSVSGVNSRTAFPPFVCSWVESPGFTLEKCKEDYCTTGLEGLQNFLSSGVAVYKENMRNGGAAVGFFLAIQMVQLFLVLCIRRRRRPRGVLPTDESWADEDLHAVAPSTQVRTLQVKPKLERRISVGTDLAFSGTYTGPQAAGGGRRARAQVR